MADGQAPRRGVAPRFDESVVFGGLAWVTARHARALVALALLSLVVFLPGIATIPPVDRDEPRFAQATKQMLETGNYIDIRLQDEPRYKKPVGIYWLQAAVVSLAGEGADAPIGAYRLASVLGALAAVLLTYWATLPLFGRRAAFVAGAAMALSLILTVEAHLAKTDATLLATVLLAQGALARIYLPTESGRTPLSAALLFWIGLGLGILVKGPVIVMVSGLTIATLCAVDRKFAWLKGLRPLIGVPLAAAIVLPWLVAILTISGGAFLTQSIGTDLLGKVGSGAEGHFGPPGLHFVLFWFIFFPAVMLVPLALPFVVANRRLAAVRFALAWIVPSWIVFEAVTTKLPHYTLPLYPAIAALVGAAVVDGLPKGERWTRLAALPAALFAVAIPAAGVALLVVLENRWSVTAMAAAVAAAALAAFAARAALRDAPVAAATFLGGAALVGYVATYGSVLPHLDTFRVSGRLAAAVAAAGCPDPQVASAGYAEPSLVFLVGTGTELGKGAEAADFLAGGGCRIALVEARQLPPFAARSKALGLDLDRLGVVRGLNIGGFRRVEVGVYRLLPQTAAMAAATPAGAGGGGPRLSR